MIYLVTEYVPQGEIFGKFFFISHLTDIINEIKL